MNANAVLQVLIFLLVILAFVKPLGWYMARVYEGKNSGLHYILRPFEYFLYRLCNINPKQEMEWKRYLSAMLCFNLLGLLAVYAIQRLQFYLPLNTQGFSAVPPDLAFNTAVSFASNASWQAYGGESTLSYFSQMTAITVQSFLSSATGISLLLAFVRGLSRCATKNLGNFWVDTVRGTLYILLPLSIILAIILGSQGVIQNFNAYQKVKTLTLQEQVIPMGPVASQVAIKELGSDGGGFFNVNSAHPFENPNPLSNFVEMLAFLLIPASFCYTFGLMVNDKRQGWAILAAMFILFIPMIYLAVSTEQQGNPAFTQMGIDQVAQDNLSSGGNMEGKETRFGIVNSALWAAATTATSNGSVNSMHDSFMPLGGFVPFWLMHLGEIVFGGVGSGLYGMLMLVIIAVFIAGLMVGRMPTYLGKRIEPYEMKMASFAILLMPVVVLVCTAIAAVSIEGTRSILNPSAHGFSEMLYAFASMVNTNGSAFMGLKANTPFYNVLGAFAMFLGRYWLAIPALAIAGSLVQKRLKAQNLGTLSTHAPFFIVFLMAVIVAFGALSFLPALALGPIVEHLMLGSK